MSNECSISKGEIRAMIFFKGPSKYMIKKYGWKEAMNKALVKHLKKLNRRGKAAP